MNNTCRSGKHMAYKKALVSIGMPVYNGEDYIRQTLDALLAQDYENFELIISDNASTDRTASICLSYAKMDNRIRYHRNNVNIGAASNFNQVMNAATGEYFMWAACDDLYDARYISSLVTLLQANQKAVLAFSLETMINEDGQRLRMLEQPRMLFSGRETRFSRLRRFIWFRDQQSLASLVYGIFSTAIIQQTSGFQDYEEEYWGRDLHLLLRVLLEGSFVCSNSALFYKRAIRANASKWPQNQVINPILRKITNWLASNRTGGDGNVAAYPNIILKINRCLRRLKNWSEIYDGYCRIIANSDLPVCRRNFLQFLGLIRCFWRQTETFIPFAYGTIIPSSIRLRVRSFLKRSRDDTLFRG